MKTEIGGYAEELPNGTVRVRGQYGREAYIPIDELDTLVVGFNKEVWNKNGRIEDITLRQITGSSGPSDKFVRFYLNKQYGDITQA